MDMKKRILLGIGVLAVDLVVFFLPLTAIFLAYIFIFNPPWFREFLNNLEKTPSRVD
ncbi:MAG: hypothetical protein JRH06_05660 [Deltaproteobacteria bacterium]|nr:hypothetical protein [Deltaproteobacteria bacterium]